MPRWHGRSLMHAVAARMVAVGAVTVAVLLAARAGPGVFGSAAGVTAAQGVGPPPVVGPEAIIIRPPSETRLRLSVETDRRSYRVGEAAHVFITLNQPAYVYLINLDTAGRVQLLLPNRYEPDNWLPAGTTTLPRHRYGFIVGGPSGTEYLQAIAVTRPLRGLHPWPPRATGKEELVQPPPGDDEWVEAADDDEALFAPDEVFARARDPLHLQAQVRRRIADAVGNGQWAAAWTSVEAFGAPARGVLLRVLSRPAEAAVYLDGRFIGRTPMRHEAEAGVHALQVVRAGYWPWQTQLNLDGIEALTLDVELQR